MSASTRERPAERCSRYTVLPGGLDPNAPDPDSLRLDPGPEPEAA